MGEEENKEQPGLVHPCKDLGVTSLGLLFLWSKMQTVENIAWNPTSVLISEWALTNSPLLFIFLLKPFLCLAFQLQEKGSGEYFSSRKPQELVIRTLVWEVWVCIFVVFTNGEAPCEHSCSWTLKYKLVWLELSVLILPNSEGFSRGKSWILGGCQLKPEKRWSVSWEVKVCYLRRTILSMFS